MGLSQIYIDVLCATHLTCFAAGMGTGLYFDFRTFQTFSDPLTTANIDQLERIHGWISTAFIGLWVTGLTLVYVRTAFDVTAFSPKLWVKIVLMVIMTWNSRLIASFVIPLMVKNLGTAMIHLPTRAMAAATQVAITSMFCWTSGLMLGSSTYLKTAPWEVVLPLAVVWFALLTVGGHLVVSHFRLRALDAEEERQQQLVFDYG